MLGQACAKDQYDREYPPLRGPACLKPHGIEMGILHAPGLWRELELFGGESQFLRTFYDVLVYRLRQLRGTRNNRRRVSRTFSVGMLQTAKSRICENRTRDPHGTMPEHATAHRSPIRRRFRSSGIAPPVRADHYHSTPCFTLSGPAQPNRSHTTCNNAPPTLSAA